MGSEHAIFAFNASASVALTTSTGWIGDDLWQPYSWNASTGSRTELLLRCKKDLKGPVVRNVRGKSNVPVNELLPWNWECDDASRVLAVCDSDCT